MTSAMEKQDKFMKSEMQSLQENYEKQYQKVQSQQMLSSQELHRQYKIAENSMESEMASLKANLEMYQNKTLQLQAERQKEFAERRANPPPSLSPVTVASYENRTNPQEHLSAALPREQDPRHEATAGRRDSAEGDLNAIDKHILETITGSRMSES